MELIDDLRRMGLGAGDTVLVRSATRRIKVGSGGPAKGLCDALLSAVGPTGNLVALSFTGDYYFWQKQAARLDPFKATKRCGTGALPQILLDHPASVRSAHPTNSFVAIGTDAAEITRGHDEHSTSFFPIDRIKQLRGKLLLVGCTTSNPGFSTVHRVQEDLGLADKTLLSGKRICAVETPQDLHWFVRKDISGCNAGFGKFYPHYAAHGSLKVGQVGGVDAMLVEASTAYEIERTILERDPTFALCDDPLCTSCGLRTYAPARMARFFLSVPRKIMAKILAR